ncbi:MAG: hypothetical protein WAZ98_03760 [Cyclobacteriaceae bacterium]
MIEPLKISGQIELIKDERQLQNSFVVDFILSSKEHERTHHYFMRAYSAGESDRFKLSELLGKEVTINCYLNGKKAEGKRGTFYTNELRVKTIQVI